MSKFQRPGQPKPAVPKNGDKPIHGLVSDKNFIVANAVENILAGKFSSQFLSKLSRILSSDKAILLTVTELLLEKNLNFVALSKRFIMLAFVTVTQAGLL